MEHSPPRACLPKIGFWLSVLLGVSSLSSSAPAASRVSTLSVETLATYNALPLTASGDAPAIVMLGLSVDEQLHRRAYDDVSDLDSDGLIDSGYRDTLDYLGYFDPRLCYRYASDRYKAATTAGGIHGHHCQGNWSGNFLNWASMSRLDLLRWSLYGGRRSVDSAASTVLERSHQPPDSHAWAAFHGGSDIGLYTPFEHDPASPGLSLCNVSHGGDGDAESATSTAAPLLRVARGLHRLWAASEGRQCLWREESGSLDQPLRSQDYQLRVEVCDASAAAELREAFCRSYPNGLKPAGVLQKYGESGQMLFGLLSGSYAKPRSGGQLRRNAMKFAGNGTAVCAAGDEIDPGSGQFCAAAAGTPGIVNTLDRLRLAHYRSRSGAAGHLDCDGSVVNRGGISPPSLISPGAGNQICNSWGNPVAELHAELLRYLSGEKGPTAAFVGDDSSFISGLPHATWKDAWAQTEHCADCNVLLLSASANSFDSDELPAVPALGGNIAAAATTAIGSHESSGGQPLTGPSLIGRVGETATDTALPSNADHCTIKSIGDLALARGICPTAAAQEGSYLVAGLAYRAWTGDLRPDRAGDGKSLGQQRARSHAIEFGSIRPSLPISTRSGTLVLSPACESNVQAAANPASTDWRSCSPGMAQLASLRSVHPRDEVMPALPPYLYGREQSADGRAGSLLMAWDTSTYGGDQDRDLLQMISWCVGSRCLLDQNPPAGPDICWRSAGSGPCSADGQFTRSVGEDEVLIRVELLMAATPDAARLGYVISGASSGNGIHTPLQRAGGDDDSLIDGSAEPAQSSGTPAGAASRWSRPEVRSFVPGRGDGRQLETPLLLAAKYGGFDYPDGVAHPLPSPGSGHASCSDSSWDHLDNASGRQAPDCLPDQYHALANPGLLKQRLEMVLDGIRRRAGRATEAQVLSGSTTGPGASYQTYYRASASDRAGRRSDWIGDLQALFVDRKGRLREDGNGNAQLDDADYSTRGDPVIEFERGSGSRPRFRRYSADPAVDPSAFTLIDDPEALRTIWRAGRQLSRIGDAETQRDYSTSAATGRYLFTFADFNLDGKAQAGEQVAFVPSTFGEGRQGLLNVASTSAAAQLVNYTRGSEFPELRSRTIDIDDDGQTEIMRLGDIVNSVPLVVGAPAEAYDLIYGDRSYAEFFNRYRSRRQIVYVGANDGLLHAFNAGFFEPATQHFRTTPASGGRATDHPLGSELWAYVPFNLLPQLGWLADPRYGHVWAMDGSPRAFDARVFAADSDHPNGWGTLLVVGMRLGGGPVTLPEVGSTGANRAAVSAFAAGLSSRSTLITRSAYVILDITNPEQPPKLIAEYADAEGRLGYTTSTPALAAFGNRNASSSDRRSDRWLLWFGNGPDDPASATSRSNARLFGLDLGSLVAAANSNQPAVAAVIGGSPIDFGGNAGSGAPASFVGDPVTVDWDLDFLADALYVGSSGGTAANPNGKLFKLSFNGSATMSNWSTPAVLLDVGRPVLAAPSATQDRDGRHWLLSGSGRLLAVGDRSSRAAQALFGVIDGLPAKPAPSFANLVDTSAALVSNAGLVSGVSNVGSEAALLNATVGNGGWRHELASSESTPAERSISGSSLIDGLLFATSYTPSNSLCTGDGSSRLYGIDFRTGAARSQRPAFGITRVIVNNAAIERAEGVLDLGTGLSLRPSLHLDTTSTGTVGVLRLTLPNSRGGMPQAEIGVSRTIRSGEIDWRQMRGRR